jgi:hypothetical protein
MTGSLPLLHAAADSLQVSPHTAWHDDPTLSWINVGAELAIWVAYMSIPALLAFYVVRGRDLVLPRVLWLFVAFIVVSGFSHFMEAAVFWWPVYRLSAAVKLCTAVVSVATVVSLFSVLPRALAMRKLADAAARLERENEERRRAEERIVRLNDQLANSMRDLERLNQSALGRDEHLTELKRQVNQLSRELGRRQPYDLSFADGA